MGVRTLLHNSKRLAAPEGGGTLSRRLLEGRWRAMGAKILRFAVFTVIAFLVIIYLAPKAY